MPSMRECLEDCYSMIEYEDVMKKLEEHVNIEKTARD